MSIKPAYLFFLLSFISLVFIFLIQDAINNLDFIIHETYFVTDEYPIFYFEYCFILSIVTGLIYVFLEWIDRPVKYSTGFLHFGLTVTGLMFFLPLGKIIIVMTGKFGEIVMALISFHLIWSLIGLGLLSIALISFIAGITSALWTGNKKGR